MPDTDNALVPFTAQFSGQDITTIFGKILRLDVNAPAPFIPPDNPFVGVAGAAEEIYHLGVRNPWRFTFDRLTGDMYIGDVGRGAIEEVKKKKKATAATRLRFEAFSEGNSAQVMHIGPFSEEGPTIEKLHQFIEENGFNLSGKHHEIYLSDFRRAAPEKLKTILRQPIS